MKKANMAKIGLEELKIIVNTYKTLTEILIGIVLAMFVVIIIPNIDVNLFAFKFLPVSFLPILIVNIKTTRKLIIELKSRK